MPRTLRWPDRIAKSRAFRWSAIALVVAAGLILGLMITDVVIDKPLRLTMERRINEALTGYDVHVGAVDLHVFGLSIDLEKVQIAQEVHPDPPVAFLPSLHASVQWKALLTGHLVGDVVFEQPTIHIDLAQLSEESGDDVPLRERGWQDALATIYPLKINALEVNDARVVYQDEESARPLQLSHVHFHADNVRNVKSDPGSYPSDIHLAGTVFDRGSLVVDGAADFLAEPFPAVKARLRVADMDLEYFEQIARRSNLLVKGGVLGTSGEFEYGPDVRRLDLDDVVVDRAKIDYLHTSATAAAEERRRVAASEAARKIASDSQTVVRIRQIDVHDSEFGYRNEAADPDYRLYLTHGRLELRNLVSSGGTVPATARLTGRFMGDAPLRAHATFREGPRPDFDVKVAVEDGRLDRLNDLLRAYAKLDVVSGRFSLYTDVRVKNGFINGYVKPLFHDVDVYDARQDRKKSPLKKAYEAIAGGLVKLLENHKRGETATVTSISGPVEDVRANTPQIIGNLIQNAFFKAILPGFEGRVKMGHPKTKPKDPERGRTRRS